MLMLNLLLEEAGPMENNMMSKIFELECLLLIFIHFNAKFKVTCKNGDFEYRYIRPHSKEKPFKIYNIAFAILSSHQNI